MPIGNIKAVGRKWLICFILGVLLVSFLYIKNKSNMINETENVKEIDSYSAVLSLEIKDSKFSPLPSNHLVLDEELEYNITFSSTLKDVNQYMFFIIVNNKIQDFYLEDKLVDHHIFELVDNDSEQINFKFPIETEMGLHNGLLVFVPEPTIKIADDHRRLKEDPFIARFTVEKERDRVLVNHFNESVNADLYKSPNPPNEPRDFFLTEQKVLELPMKTNTIAQVTDKNSLRYYAHKANYSKYTNHYTLLALKDWKTTNINESEAIHFTLNPNEKITFPLEVEVDLAMDNNKELIFLLIENPTFIMDAEFKEKYINENYNIEVFTSQRILLLDE